MAKDKKVQWHPAFYGALHLEFKENKEELEFTEELILNTMPLRVDMLVVKKRQPCMIQNEIGRMFQKHNLIEYKSPDDVLNYDVFLKGIAYAYLYKSKEANVDGIPLEEITLTFIRERKPIKLFKKLQSEHIVIEEKWSGIYYINREENLRIQIVVTKELSRKNHRWLNSLSENLSKESLTQLVADTWNLKQNDDKLYADSLWEVVARVNKDAVKEIRQEDEVMCKALAEIMKPEMDEAFNNGFNNGFNDGVSQGAENMQIQIAKNLLSVLSDEEIAEKTELAIEIIKGLRREVVQ